VTASWRAGVRVEGRFSRDDRRSKVAIHYSPDPKATVGKAASWNKVFLVERIDPRSRACYYAMATKILEGDRIATELGSPKVRS
jgi:hypothetical protein